MRRIRGAVLLGALAILAGCGGGGDPVRDSLDAIVRGAGARDANAIFEHVAPEFQAADGSGFADAKATVDRYLAAYESLSVSIRDVRIERSEGAARVRFRAEMSGKPRRIGGLDGLVPSSASYDFDLRLVQQGGAWKVAWAQWNPEGDGGRNP